LWTTHSSFNDFTTILFLQTTEPSRYTKLNPTKTTTRTKTTTEKITKKEEEEDTSNPCQGECVNGLFALFCDDIDENAYCPSEGSCCITTGEQEKVVVTTTTSKPTTVIIFKLQ
jgi:Clip-domain serine protease homolog masquerade